MRPFKFLFRLFRGLNLSPFALLIERDRDDVKWIRGYTSQSKPS